VSVSGELTLEEQFEIPAGHPIGLGWRVPLFLVSPWSRGDYVFSEVSDHSSVIQFIERRFNVTCPNISPWRRAVTSDLTHAFDWEHPDFTWPEAFPNTSANVNASKWQCDNLPPPQVPVVQSMPGQEAGTKKQRPIPSYVFHISDAEIVEDDGDDTTRISLSMSVGGDATDASSSLTAGVFSVYNRSSVVAGSMDPPRMYTVEQGKTLSDVWTTRGDRYELHLHGPNGFVRVFQGDLPNKIDATVRVTYDPKNLALDVAATSSSSSSSSSSSFQVVDNAYGTGLDAKLVAGGDSVRFDASKSGGWYDLSVRSTEDDSWVRRYMGKIEGTTETTTTDPAMAEGVPHYGHESPRTPFVREALREDAVRPMPSIITDLNDAKWSERWAPTQCTSARGRMKDACWDYYHARDEL